MRYSKQMYHEPLYTSLSEAERQTLICAAETRYQQEIQSVCDEIIALDHRIVLLTGPSGSGKTTTANQIVQQMAQRGKKARRISLDNFYKDENTLPLWEDGNINYESVEALDIAHFRKIIQALLQNGSAALPLHDFKTGTRRLETETITYDRDTVLVFEGIHALNPRLGSHLADDEVYRIYVSVHSDFVGEQPAFALAAREVRFLRRLLRDELHRHTDVSETLGMWGYVLKGEKLYIQPFRELADRHINSTHCYEPYLYAARACALLERCADTPLQADMVSHLLQVLPLLPTIDPALIPASSLIQEFIS